MSIRIAAEGDRGIHHFQVEAIHAGGGEGEGLLPRGLGVELLVFEEEVEGETGRNMVGAHVGLQLGHGAGLEFWGGNHFERATEEQAAYVAVGIEIAPSAAAVVAQDDE